MQQVKTVTVVIFGLAILSIIGGVVYVELVAIPALLARYAGQYSPLVHVLLVLFLAASWGEARAWMVKRHIFTTQQELVTPHLNHVINAIDHLVVGKWQADSSAYTGLIGVGARMGYAMGKAAVDGEPDRAQIEAGIASLSLPAPRQAAGQGTDEVDKMRKYMDGLESRKDRLSDGD